VDPVALGGSTLTFNAAGSSEITFGALSGNGKLLFPDNAISSPAFVTFTDPSPNFDGQVSIGSGDGISMQDPDAFGSSSIQIAAGGTLGLNGLGTTSLNLSNNITMGGNGTAASPSSTTGSYSGAINACLTPGEEYCPDGGVVTLSGNVTLTSNTELGASYSGGSSQAPTSTTITYNIAKPLSGNYSLTAVPDSMVVIQK
jgi:hypothetical protein